MFMGQTIGSKINNFVKEIDKQEVKTFTFFDIERALKKYFGFGDSRTGYKYIKALVELGYYKQSKAGGFERTKKRAV